MKLCCENWDVAGKDNVLSLLEIDVAQRLQMGFITPLSGFVACEEGNGGGVSCVVASC